MLNSKTTYQLCQPYVKNSFSYADAQPKVRLLTMSEARRIKEARISAGLSQGKLAKLIGVSRAAVSQWEDEGPNGTSPDGENLLKCAKFLKVTPEYIKFGEPMEPVIDIHNTSFKIQKIPYIEWQHLEQFARIRDLTQVPHKEIPVYLQEDESINPNSIAISVVGNAMVPKESSPDTLYPGDTAVIEMDRTVEPNDIVLVQTKDGCVLRQYTQDGTIISLTALNERFMQIPFREKDMKVLGVLTHIIRGKKKKI